jgi:hypothetical protein
VLQVRKLAFAMTKLTRKVRKDFPVPWRLSCQLPAAAVNQGHNFQRWPMVLRAGPLQAAPLGKG